MVRTGQLRDYCSSRSESRSGRIELINKRLATMQYAVPQYLARDVNAAGKILAAYAASKSLSANDTGVEVELLIVNNWRASHAYPAHILFCGLKRHAKKIYAAALVAQRNKRLPSILAKLSKSGCMKLSQMQDIGGCRAVVKTMKQVRALENDLASAWHKHGDFAVRDYIDAPKEDGYRSLHLKYRFAASGTKQAYNGLKIEGELRTELQHRWATGVEAVDTFTKQSLKASAGRPEWARFFVVISALYAISEDCAPIPGIDGDSTAVVEELKHLESMHNFTITLRAIKEATRRVESQAGAQLFLVMLDSTTGVASVRGYKGNEQASADADYAAAEKAIADDQQVVLIAASSVAQLRRAYPNYFLDIDDFLRDVETFLL